MEEINGIKISQFPSLRSFTGKENFVVQEGFYNYKSTLNDIGIYVTRFATSVVNDVPSLFKGIGYINKEGVVVSGATSYNHTPYLRISRNEDIYVTGLIDETGYVALYAFYDKNYGFISYFRPKWTGAEKVTVVISKDEIPENAVYIRCSGDIDSNCTVLPWGIFNLAMDVNQKVSTDILPIVSRGFFIDWGHLCNIQTEGIFTEYIKNDGYNSIHVHLVDGVKQLFVNGIQFTRFCFFRSLDLVSDNFISQNKSGIVPPDAVLCIITTRKSDNQDIDYKNILVKQSLDFVSEERFDNLFSNYIENTPTGKNYIDPDNLLRGYAISSGQVIESASGILSNKLYLKSGTTYTMQGIFFYGNNKSIFIAWYDAEGNYLNRSQFPATYEEDSHYGKATFTFDDQNGNVKYGRICLQTTFSYPFDPSISQLEVGSKTTEVEPYVGEEKFVMPGIKPVSMKRRVRILSIGNSYSQDALGYVPFILPEIEDSLDVEIGIMYMSGATLQQHYNNFINEVSAYTYYLFNGGVSWKNLGSYTIQRALESQSWDMIILQQGSTSSWDWSTYQPYLNKLVNLIYGKINYPVKFGWMLTQSRPKVGDHIYTDEEILSHFNSIAKNSQRVMNETLCEFIFPVGTAVQNARTTSLNNLGDYGKLCSSDGGHLQEGLPCQLASYVCVLTILSLCGYGNKSVYGDPIRVNANWVSGKNIPGPNGNPTGSTDANCAIAQKCVIMAMKNPYVITDMTNLKIEEI